jgi:hypothetical protein
MLPLTLLASIWMNLDFPFDPDTEAFWIAVAAMVANFRQRGWL